MQKLFCRRRHWKQIYLLLQLFIGFTWTSIASNFINSRETYYKFAQDTCNLVDSFTEEQSGAINVNFPFVQQASIVTHSHIPMLPPSGQARNITSLRHPCLTPGSSFLVPDLSHTRDTKFSELYAEGNIKFSLLRYLSRFSHSNAINHFPSGKRLEGAPVSCSSMIFY